MEKDEKKEIVDRTDLSDMSQGTEALGWENVALANLSRKAQ